MADHLLQEALGLHQQGFFAEAELRYLQLLRDSPKDVEAMDLLGQCCMQRGDAGEAIRWLKKCVKARPGFALAHWHLGDALMARREVKAALDSLRRAIAIEPRYVVIHCNIGYILLGQSKAEEALESFSRACQADPALVVAWLGLGSAQMMLGRLAAAEDSFRRALVLAPRHAEGHSNLGLVLLRGGRRADAEACFKQALECDPENLLACANLAELLADSGRRGVNDGILEDIGRRCMRVLASEPDSLIARSTYVTVLLSQGNLEAVVPELERLRFQTPDNLRTLLDLIWVRNFQVAQVSQGMYDLACEYGRRVSSGVRSDGPWRVDTAPRRLRVGFVSGDLKNHPVGYFLESFLGCVDSERIDLVAYPTIACEDDLTLRLRPRFSGWHPLFGLDDEQAAARIREDGIHVLVDLSGYSRGERLAVFARRPAPVQVSWLGYFATTGLRQMDYVLVDPVAVPASRRGDFIERVWHLPETRMCYSPPQFDVPVGALPALSSPGVTFGCFQIFEKINVAVISVWASILKALPTARIRLQAENAGSPAQVARLIQRFEQAGVSASRLEFVARVPRADYLAAHNAVDLILDTFPFPGGTTTCDALWMGVPTLTLEGESLLARQGVSLLSACGLDEWIAESEAIYVEKAIFWAGNLARLAQLRAGLREKILASPLFDAPRFARHFEDACWGMWQEKQGGHPLYGEDERHTR